MLFPVRCQTCNKAIGGRYERFLAIVAEERNRQRLAAPVVIRSDTSTATVEALRTTNRTPECVAMERLKIRLYCCRRHFLSDVDLVDLCTRGGPPPSLAVVPQQSAEKEE